MRKLAILTVALAALAVPSLSHAQVSLGLRLGFAPAAGDAMKDAKMTDGIKSQVPVQVDGLYKLNKNIGVGGYVSYGFGQGASGVSSASDLRLGIQGTYTFDAINGFAPWAGVGVGYEWAKGKLESGVTSTMRGVEFLNLQLGADYTVAPQFAVGPYVGLSLGQFDTVGLSGGGASGSASIDNKAMHEWMQFGIRGKFDL